MVRLYFSFVNHTILHLFLYNSRVLLKHFTNALQHTHSRIWLILVNACTEYCPNSSSWHTPIIPAAQHAKDSNNNGISHSEFYLQKNKSITMNMAILDSSANYMSVQFLLLILFLSRLLARSLSRSMPLFYLFVPLFHYCPLEI